MLRVLSSFFKIIIDIVAVFKIIIDIVVAKNCHYMYTLYEKKKEILIHASYDIFINLLNIPDEKDLIG